MINTGSFGKILILFGIISIIAGLLCLLGGRIPFLGRLPGDIVIERKNFSFHFPLITCLIISALLSLILWLIRR